MDLQLSQKRKCKLLTGLHYKLYHQTVCSAQRLTLNAARLARPILGTVHSERWSEARARDRFSGARALWKEASLVQCQGLRMSQGECVYESCWRGPAEVIKPMRSQGKAIVQWRGYPMLIPLRHCRPHIGFVWLLMIYSSDGNQLAGVLKALMDLVEDLFPGQVFTYGRQWNRDADEYVLVPPDLESRPPRAYELARTLARSVLLLLRFDGVQLGTAVRHTEPLANVNKSRLIEWQKMHREGYMVTSVRPDVRHTLQVKGSFTVKCFFMVYYIADGDDQEDQELRKADDSVYNDGFDDPSMPSPIPWMPAEDDDDESGPSFAYSPAPSA